MALAGLLTFALYYLIKNPESMRKAHEEVDEVLGDRSIQLADLSKLKYIDGKTTRLRGDFPTIDEFLCSRHAGDDAPQPYCT